MAVLTVDPMDNVAPWTAVEPDGVTPSTEFAIATETNLVRFGPDAASARVTATTAAFDHRLTRALPNLDLTSFDELRLSVRGQRPADGEAATPFYVGLRIGSAALPIGDPGNTWHRLLPVVANRWLTVRLAIDDLAPGVRAAADALQLRCVDAGRAFTLFLDDLLAVRPETVADVDAALVARCSGLSVNGNPVPASVRAPAEAVATPSVDIRHRAVRFSPDRARYDAVNRDYTDQGWRAMAAGEPYELWYSVSARAGTRAAQAQIVGFVLDRLSPQGELPVANLPLPIDLVWPLDEVEWVDQPELWYRIGVRAATSATAIAPVTDVTLEADLKELV